MAQGIFGDLETEMKSYVASLGSTSSTTSLSSDTTGTIAGQKSVRCPICLMKFKDPRRLKCEHMYCKSCLQAVLRRQEYDGTQLKCLICQEPAELESEGVNELDKAILVHRLEDVYLHDNLEYVKCSKCDGSRCSLCIQVICNKCSKYVSSIYCQSCQKCLCAKCTRDHTTHSLIEIEEVHTYLGQQLQKEEEERAVDDWENDSQGSSKDSGGQVNQSYGFAIDGLPEEESEGEEDGDSDGEMAQFYSVTGEGEESEEEEEKSEEEDSIAEERSRFIGHITVEGQNDEPDGSQESINRQEVELMQSDASSSSVERDLTNEEEEPEEEEEEGEDNDSSSSSSSIIEPLPRIIVNVGAEEEEEREGESNVELQRPLTVIDDDELVDLVNDTIETDIDPVQLRRLRPSAPSNEKRYSKVILLDQSTDMLGPPRYRQIRSYKWCLRITVGLIVLFIISVLIIGGLSLTAFFLSPSNMKAFVLQDEPVLLAKIKPFWSLDLSVTSIGPYDSRYYYQTDLYKTKCRLLQKITSNYIINTSGTQNDFANDFTIQVPTNRNGDGFAYLLANSQINLNINITSDTTYRACSSELNIYSDYDDFISDNGLAAIQTNCVSITKPPSLGVANQISFTSTKDSFYFITLSVPPSSTYNITTSVNSIIYNFTNIANILSDNCTILSDESTLKNKCNFTILDVPIATDLDDVCILATTRPRPSLTAQTTPSIVKMSLSSDPNIFRNFAYLLTPGPVLLYLLACLFAWACYKCCIVSWYKCKGKWKRNQYRTSVIL